MLKIVSAFPTIKCAISIFRRATDFLAQVYFNPFVGTKVLRVTNSNIYVFAYSLEFVENGLHSCRLDNEMQMDSREYLSRRRAILQKEGFHITGLISNQMDALIGQSLGKRVFKIPNPLYYSFDHQIESTKFAS